ncbi:hypothetical protein COU91_01230 [Candidatus Saccharibacteria bacterium CG10_big_fil_rev_8_21_14_0_10_47_8]|nr:MAG: hypothetical protein COU91_01230 [Candidatus Saccharibacteria bacterium CG10_big_fil_rev_8_21_14_0_10_47_8]
MQSVDIEPNAEEKLERLKGDFDKPFSPPVDIKEKIPKDYPSLDTGIDEHEWYDVGATIASAADIIKNKVVLKYRRPVKLPLKKYARKLKLKNKR